MVSVSADGAKMEVTRRAGDHLTMAATSNDQDTTGEIIDQDMNRSLVEQTEHMSIQGDNNGEEEAASQRVESPQVAVD